MFNKEERPLSFLLTPPLPVSARLSLGLIYSINLATKTKQNKKNVVSFLIDCSRECPGLSYFHGYIPELNTDG